VSCLISVLVRCPDFSDLNLYRLIQLASVLIIKVSLLVRCPDFSCSIDMHTLISVIVENIYGHRTFEIVHVLVAVHVNVVQVLRDC